MGATALSLSLVTATTAGAACGHAEGAGRGGLAARNELYAQSEREVQAYDAVHSKYLNTLARYKQTKEQVQVAKLNLAKAREPSWPRASRGVYKRGKSIPVQYMLAAKSVGDLVNEMQLYSRANSSNADLVKQVRKWSGAIKREEATQRKQTLQLQQQDAQTRQARDSAISSLHAAQAYKANLDAQVRDEIAREQRARERAAAAAAAAAQAAQQAPTTTTASTGGSGGGTGSYDVPAPPASTLGGQAVAIAEHYLGVPYVWGGASPSGSTAPAS